LWFTPCNHDFTSNAYLSAERLLKALNALLLTLCRLTKEVSSGSVVVNDCLFQFANLYAPFGGVGESGMGGYHGTRFFTGGVVCVVLLCGLRALSGQSSSDGVHVSQFQ
jgi:hypothetical protein